MAELRESIRIERVPVASYWLGVFGFDHLQIVYQRADIAQHGWFVLEGLREPSGTYVRLAIEGWPGATTLTEANGGLDEGALDRKLGSAADRGSREIVSGPDVAKTWAHLVSYAADLDAQRFPYIAYALSSSPLPTVNSSSAVASLLFHAGYDLAAAMPYGVRFSPGTSTLLGTGSDDILTASERHSTLLGGTGNDTLSAAGDIGVMCKLYGGRGDDLLHWAPGQAIYHGGEPELDYAEDGIDAVNVSGAGLVQVDAGEHPSAHLVADYVITTPQGNGQLFSVEELRWDRENDHVVLGSGVALADHPLRLRLGAGGDVLDARTSRIATTVDAGAGDDTIYAGRGLMTLTAGEGRDRLVVTAGGAKVTWTDAVASDLLVVDWPRAEVRAFRAPNDARDLIVRISNSEEEPSEIRLLHFLDGDVGRDPPVACAPLVDDKHNVMLRVDGCAAREVEFGPIRVDWEHLDDAPQAALGSIDDNFDIDRGK